MIGFISKFCFLVFCFKVVVALEDHYDAEITPEGVLRLVGGRTNMSKFSFVVCEMPMSNTTMFYNSCAPKIPRGTMFTTIFEDFRTSGELSDQFEVQPGNEITHVNLVDFGYDPTKDYYFYYEFAVEPYTDVFHTGWNTIQGIDVSPLETQPPETDQPSECLCGHNIHDVVVLTQTHKNMPPGTRGKIQCGTTITDWLLILMEDFDGGRAGSDNFCGCDEEGPYVTTQMDIIACSKLEAVDDCGPLNINNITTSSYDICANTLKGDSCEISCDRDFRLAGVSTVSCDRHGSWQQDLPSCELIYCDLDELNIENSNILGDCSNGVASGTSCNTGCITGYRYGENEEFSVACDGGEWQEPLQECADFDECITGTHNCDENALCTNHPGGYTCECHDQYMGDGFSCNAPCPTPEVDHSILDCDEMILSGMKCEYSCERDYVLDGDLFPTCVDGAWDGEFPECNHVCEGIVCENPSHDCENPIGTCDGGNCFYENKSDGSRCNDDDPVTENDICTSGVCAGTDPCEGIVCDSPTFDCEESSGTCVGGDCIYQNKPDGSLCDDNDSNTVNDICTDGVCTGTVGCESNEWECLSGGCISANQYCDGFIDCDDDSDENNCPTITPSTPNEPTDCTKCSAQTCKENGLKTIKDGVCAASGDKNLGTCSGLLNRTDAILFCGNVGMRLCTEDELENDAAIESGCGNDWEIVWSSTPCGSGNFSAVPGSSKATNINKQCKDPAESVYVRCCADEFISIPPCCENDSNELETETVVTDELDHIQDCNGVTNATYNEAKSHCENIGARLCTEDEEENDFLCTCFSDSLDAHNLDNSFWTSTECETRDISIQQGHLVQSVDANGRAKCALNSEEIVGVKCCADSASSSNCCSDDCTDDIGWESEYGDCDTYSAGHLNYGHCGDRDNDGVVAIDACCRSCCKHCSQETCETLNWVVLEK